jgi:integrase
MSKRNASGALIVVERDGGPVYYAKWRDSGRRQVKRRLGPAWVERSDGGDWRKRRGRAHERFLDEKAAIVEMRRVIDAHEVALATVRPESEPTFDDAAADWLHRLEHVDGAKPSTLEDYRLMLARPDAPARKRGLRTAGRIVGEFGGQELRSITTAQVERFLARLDSEPISKRTVNKHRQVVCSILEHAARRPERFGIRENVARATAKRREPDAGVLDFYEPEEVAALARAAREGRHRDPRRPAVSEAEASERCLADEQEAALYTVAAFTGLRLGELRALRWRQVSFERGTLTVAAAMSAGQVESPKWGKARTVPLATPAAAELARLADRGRFVEHDDLVFCGPLGDTLDDSAIRRRLRRAQKAAGLRPLRFHDLRHSFGSLVVRELDTATLKGWLGHTSLATTERYLHAKPRHSDVARLDRAFAGSAGEADLLVEGELHPG